jgi:hypothetical protein
MSKQCLKVLSGGEYAKVNVPRHYFFALLHRTKAIIIDKLGRIHIFSPFFRNHQTDELPKADCILIPRNEQQTVIRIAGKLKQSHKLSFPSLIISKNVLNLNAPKLKNISDCKAICKLQKKNECFCVSHSNLFDSMHSKKDFLATIVYKFNTNLFNDANQIYFTTMNSSVGFNRINIFDSQFTLKQMTFELIPSKHSNHSFIGGHSQQNILVNAHRKHDEKRSHFHLRLNGSDYSGIRTKITSTPLLQQHLNHRTKPMHSCWLNDKQKQCDFNVYSKLDHFIQIENFGKKTANFTFEIDPPHHHHHSHHTHHHIKHHQHQHQDIVIIRIAIIAAFCSLILILVFGILYIMKEFKKIQRNQDKITMEVTSSSPIRLNINDYQEMPQTDV